MTNCHRALLGSLIFALVTSSFSVAQAGAEGSGGGNAIACLHSGSGQSVELLDYYEARLTMNVTLDLGPDTDDYLKRVDYVLNRLSKVDPISADRFRVRARSFLSEAHFLSAEEMKSLADGNELVNPAPGCVKEQFAIQVFHLKPEQSRYLLNGDLWKIADSKAKAGLVLHEIIYTDAVNSFAQNSSDNVRYYNAMISSNFMDNVTAQTYWQLLSDSGFLPTADSEYCVGGCENTFSIKWHELVLTPGSDHHMMQILSPVPFVAEGASMNNPAVYPFETMLAVEPMEDHVQFEKVVGPNTFKLIGYDSSNDPQFLVFNLAGKVLLAGLDEDQTISLQGQSVRLDASGQCRLKISEKDFFGNVGAEFDGDIAFWGDGALRCATIEGGVTLRGADGKAIQFHNGFFSKNLFTVDLDESGRVLDFKQVRSE